MVRCQLEDHLFGEFCGVYITVCYVEGERKGRKLKRMEWSPSTSLQLNMAAGALVPEEITPKLSKTADCTSPKNEWHGPVPYIPSVLELRSNGMSYQPQ